eukprot:COSAG01_NODE_4052_length_5395_cov_2.586813_4_plen_48_part_00
MHVLQPSSYLRQVATWTRPGSYWDVFSQPGSYQAGASQPGSSLAAAG